MSTTFGGAVFLENSRFYMTIHAKTFLFWFCHHQKVPNLANILYFAWNLNKCQCVHFDQVSNSACRSIPRPVCLICVWSFHEKDYQNCKYLAMWSKNWAIADAQIFQGEFNQPPNYDPDYDITRDYVETYLTKTRCGRVKTLKTLKAWSGCSIMFYRHLDTYRSVLCFIPFNFFLFPFTSSSQSRVSSGDKKHHQTCNSSTYTRYKSKYPRITGFFWSAWSAVRGGKNWISVVEKHFGSDKLWRHGVFKHLEHCNIVALVKPAKFLGTGLVSFRLWKEFLGQISDTRFVQMHVGKLICIIFAFVIG